MKSRLIGACMCVTLLGSLFGSPRVANGQGVTGFLTSATQGLSDNDVVRSACKSAQTIAQYQGLLNNAGGLIQQWGSLSQTFGANGIPVADVSTSVAANAYAHAVQQGAQSEAYSLTFALGSMCNTSQTTLLAQQQFDFLHNIVNAAIQNPLPKILNSLSSTERALSPVPEAQRADRYARLFGHTPTTSYVPSANVAAAAVDSSTGEAYLLAARADSVATATLKELNTFAGEVQRTGDPNSPGCLALAGTGDAGAQAAVASDSTACGPISPGRADQISASVLFLNTTQVAMTNQLTARRMDLESVRAQADVRQDFIKAVGNQYAIKP
jgi:hypothetical protein